MELVRTRQRTRRAAAMFAGAAGVLGVAWFALYLAQPLLGYEDTDDPALGVQFVRDYPQVVAVTGVVVLVFAGVLVLAATSLAELHEDHVPRWPIRATTAFGLISAACLLVFGTMRIGVSGPLLHIADLRQEWGEAAYLVVQMAGVQGVLPAGVLALALWASGWSVIGWRARTLPAWLCLLGIIPALHVIGRLVGELGVVTGAGWLVVVVTIPGTMLWVLALGVGLALGAQASTAADSPLRT